MLAVNDLINIQHMPEMTDISLKLIVDFYEQYLCKHIFIFELENKQKVKLFFKDTSEIFHLSGINHIYGNNPMDGTRFVEGVKSGAIDFITLERINKPAYTDYINRIRGMACIDTILKKCEYLWFSGNLIPDSSIKIKYLLLKGLDNKNLHLGIDTYKEGRPFIPKTFLVTEGNIASKYIDKADERIRVAAIEIIEKDSNNLIERVDRALAINEAEGAIFDMGKRWISESLPRMFEEYIKIYGNSEPNSRKRKEWVSKLVKYLESNQDAVRNIVKKYDPYWTEKIVAEQIRKFSKDKAGNIIKSSLDQFGFPAKEKR